MSVVNNLIKIDQRCDAVPILSTTSSLATLFIKSIYPVLSDSAKNNRYISHIRYKDTRRCVIVLLLPVLGDIYLKKEFIDLIRKVERASSELELMGHHIHRLPESIFHLTDLSRLELSYNRIVSLPAEIGRLTNLTVLALNDNKLTFLPAEIGQLSKLASLSLGMNQLTSLPTEIGRLTNLTYLFLYGNKLSSLPTEIGMLTELLSLYPRKNRLTSLPSEIGRLTKLNDLELTENRLASLPSTFGQLSSLKRIDLDHNQLLSLPNEIGQLTQVTILSINHNPLQNLPLSLGEMSSLLSIFCDLPYTVWSPILNQCRALRDDNAEAILPLRLAKWAGFAESTLIKTNFLDENQKITLNEWLLRLENTRDFEHSQSQLAKTVCAILNDLKHPEFRDFFFSQAEANTTHCDDRTAMSLNEIYISWLLLCQNSDSKKFLAGIAKTLYLRKALQKLIPPNERETVEIFLYYETHLRNELQLETAIQTMRYETIGRRAWINQEKLIQDVKKNYHSELIDIPIFAQMMQKRWEPINERFQAKLEALGDCPRGGEEDTLVLNFKARQGEIMAEWRCAKIGEITIDFE